MTPHGWRLALVGVENFILVNAVLSIVGFGAAAIVRARKRAFSGSPHKRASFYAATLVVPPVVSAWLVCASLLPALWLGGGEWLEEHEPVHSIHLLNAFTIPLDPTLGYATAIFALLGLLVAAYAALSAYFRISGVIRRLEIGAEPANEGRIKIVSDTCQKHGIAVGLVASRYPFSFVWGYWDSKLVVSTGLLNSLSIEELASVLEHEAAHHTRRDNLTKLILTICSLSAIMLVGSLLLFPLLGREFLPPFNEGTLNINANLPPGTSLKESNRVGNLIEQSLHEVPEIVSTTRRTGRAELDEHAAGVNTSEIEVVTKEGKRKHTEVMEEVRQRLSQLPGVAIEVGQPISHRIDHLLSGTRAQIAIKLFGPDLSTLRTKANEIRDAMGTVAGIVDLLVEPQVGVPQVQLNLKRSAAAAVGLTAENLAESVEVAFNGEVVSQVLEEQRTYDVLVRFKDSARDSVEAVGRTLIDTPTGAKVPIAQVAEVRTDQGPNTINRENVQRRIIIQANVAGRDLGSVINDVRSTISQKVTLPQGYFVQYGGQFESQEKASRQITLLSILAIGGIFLLLYIALKSIRASLLVMANLPLALIGGVVMVFFSGGTLSVASLIGFITLFGIATRNGIMLISHYRHLMEEEGVGFRDAIVQGSMERLSPILMTALVTGMGLIPLALGAGDPGREIQQPMAVVILGGIVTSTLLNMIVIPALYLKYGRESAREAGSKYDPKTAAVTP